MAFILTRLNVGDYDAWKAMFDKGQPGARRFTGAATTLTAMDVRIQKLR
jgi:hypothetical protein